MIWLDHSRDPHRGEHALFSPSQMSWINDSTENDVYERYSRGLAKDIGTIIHGVAKKCISTKTRLSNESARSLIRMELLDKGIPEYCFNEETLADNFLGYLNDTLDHNMRAEQELYYSEWCYGTADAISVDNYILRINDLKTGITPAKFLQLEIYAALFFLDLSKVYRELTPDNCEIELRIFQGGEVLEEFPSADVIVPIMDSIIWHSETMDKLKEGN